MTERQDESREATENFSRRQNLPPRWGDLKGAMRRIVERPDFWYRIELRDAARVLAVEASAILDSALYPGRPSPQEAEQAQARVALPQEIRDAQAGEYDQWMRRAISLARTAKLRGDTPVGSLVVRGGEVLGEGIEAVKSEMDVAAHSETIAIREATRRVGKLDLSGCTLVTTAEPCFLCSYSVRQSRLAKVVIGSRVAEIGGASSRHPILTDEKITTWGPPPEVIFGVLEAECLALHDL